MGCVRTLVFPIRTPLPPDQQKILLERLAHELKDWQDHGIPLKWHARIYRNVLLVLRVEHPHASRIDGCALDYLYRVLQMLERTFRLSLLDFSAFPVELETGEICWLTRHELKEWARKGRDGKVLLYDRPPEEGIPISGIIKV